MSAMMNDKEEGRLSAPRPNKSTSKRTVLKATLILFIITTALFHQPIRHCFDQVAKHCSRNRSVEHRARKILETTPLIGKQYL